jgi:CRISPR-associated protein Cas5h
MTKLISIDLYAEFGMLKKPDTNEPVYLTFNMLHKPALLGILGAIAGLKGFEKKGVLPEYYTQLQNLKVGIQPLNHENGNYQKTTISYNNTTGMASKEKGGNLMVNEQTLVAPAFRCYFLLDIKNELHQKIDHNLANHHAEFLPYLGKNEFSVWWKDYKEYDDVEDFDFSKEYKIGSLFYKNEAISNHIAKAMGRAMRKELKTRFAYFERLPVQYQEIAPNQFQYEYADFVFTNARFNLDLKLESIQTIEDNTLIQFF